MMDSEQHLLPFMHCIKATKHISQIPQPVVTIPAVSSSHFSAFNSIYIIETLAWQHVFQHLETFTPFSSRHTRHRAILTQNHASSKTCRASAKRRRFLSCCQGRAQEFDCSLYGIYWITDCALHVSCGWSNTQNTSSLYITSTLP